MKNVGLGRIILGIVLGVALGGGGMWWLASAPPPQSSTDPPGHGHEAEGGADEHGHADGALVLTEKAVRESGIEVATAGGGQLDETLTLPGEIVLNADRVAHIVPRVGGIVRRVDKNLGDDVQAGEVMAILESRELAEAKAAYLAAEQRLSLAEANLKSAEELHAKKIMPDLEFLTIQKAKAEAEIEFRTADNKLHALGMTDEQLGEVPGRR